MRRFRQKLKEKGWDNGLIRPSGTRNFNRNSHRHAANDRHHELRSSSSSRGVQQRHHHQHDHEAERARTSPSTASSRATPPTPTSGVFLPSPSAALRLPSSSSPTSNFQVSPIAAERRSRGSAVYATGGANDAGTVVAVVHNAVVEGTHTPPRPPAPALDLTSINTLVSAGNVVKEAARILKVAPHGLGQDPHMRRMLRDAKACVGLQ